LYTHRQTKTGKNITSLAKVKKGKREIERGKEKEDVRKEGEACCSRTAF